MRLTDRQSQAALLLIEDLLDDERAPFLDSGGYYNGRERGVWLSCKNKNVVFYEHRNSDEIYLHAFEGNFLNPPNCTEIPGFDSKWHATKVYGWGQVGSLALWVANYFKEA